MWLSVLIGAVVIAALAAAYPRADVQTRTLATQRASMISVAYLEAWLLVEPDSPMYLDSLAMQYLELGRWQSALEVSKRLLRVAQDDTGKKKAFFLELVATEQMAYAQPADVPERAQGVARLNHILQEATEFPWSVAAMRSLAEKARAAGADDVMLRFYQKLALADVDNAARWQARLGEVALSTQAYETAAFSFFSAYETATALDEKRHYFIKALQVLESADKVAQACAEAQQRLGVLATDSQTLRYLLALARQANRSDLVAVYARALLNASRGTQHARNSVGAHIVLIAADAQSGRHDAAADMAGLEEEYQLVYQAFIESTALDDAEQVARMALEAGLDSVVWSARLAQAAQWNNHPDTALKYWLEYAQGSDDQEAWNKVLALAPAQGNDDAYLAAWTQRQTRLSGGVPDAAAGWNALLAEYMQAGQWASMLRVVDRLKSFDGNQTRQRTLMLEVTALEQYAYEFAPGDPQRTELMRRLHGAMEQTLPLQWDLPAMKWMAQKAQETGADAIMLHYYRELAQVDGANTAHWQEKLGDFALGRQAYQEAASAYFAAQAAAGSRDAKSRYFQAGLGAFVASGDVAQACVEGEQRVGDLVDDPGTLRYLINLARQAHRTDLMAHYARELIKATKQSRRAPLGTGLARRDAYDRIGQSGMWRAAGLPARYADFRIADAAVRVAVADAAGMPAGENTTQRENDLDVAFRALVESRQLNDAERTAQSALAEGMDPLIWTPRLAQVAEWNSHPQLALRYWLQYAQASGDVQAWASVLRLSGQLSDNAAQLAALKYLSGRAPGDAALLDQVVSTYEALGQPEAGLAYLKGRAHGSLRIPMLERYADLAVRSGNDDAAREAYEELARTGGRPHLYAKRLASMDYAQGDLAGALARLRAVRDITGDEPETVPYWRLYGELASLTQSNEDAIVAHRHLLATGEATGSDLNTLAYLYARHPIDGGRIAEMQFQNDGSPAALQSALRLYTTARAWPRIEKMLNGLTPRQQDYFRHSSPLLTARADYYAKTQRWDAALADLRQAMYLPDVTDDTRISYLWTLIDFGSEDELRVAMHQWRPVAQVNPEYWGAFAAAEMRMGNSVRAVHYLRKQRLSLGDDPLWLMALADAEEISGHVERAWNIRKLAWTLLREKAAEKQRTDPALAAERDAAPDLFGPLAPTARSHDAARVALSQILANGDYSRGLLVQLLKQEGRSPESIEVARSILANSAGLPRLAEVLPGAELAPEDRVITPAGVVGRGDVIGATAKEVVLAWALSGEEYDLARAWLARQYADRLLRPVDAEVTLALAADDRRELARLLDDRRKNITIENRIDALARTGRFEEAQTRAFAAVEGAPESDARHQLMVETLMHDRPAVGADVSYVDTDPLEYVQTTLVGGLKLTSRWGIGLEAINRNQKTKDRSILAWVPSHDQEFNFTVYNATPDRKFSLTVGARDAWDTFYTVSMRADLNRQSEFKTSFMLGLNQFTDLSQALQVAGVKDLARVSVQWDPESRWFLWGSAEASRLRDQDRTYIGRGLEFSADLGYRIAPSYPDWSVRLTATRGIYSASDNVIHSMRRLLPAGYSLAAADIVPENFTQYGVMIGFGASDQNAYWRRWRLFLDAGYVHDSEEGWGPVVNVGAGGSLLGNDHLRIFYLHTAARQGDGRASTQIGLSYRLFF